MNDSVLQSQEKITEEGNEILLEMTREKEKNNKGLNMVEAALVFFFLSGICVTKQKKKLLPMLIRPY